MYRFGVLACLVACAFTSLHLDAASRRQTGSTDDSLDLVIARAALAVESLERRLSAVVADERLEQRSTQGVMDAERLRSADHVRTTRSDFLFLRLSGDGDWLPFRDVFEVDGRAVRDRSERLQKLFVDGPQTARRDAARIADENSRYNIGSVIRTINVPTFGLLVLTPAYQGRFEFRKRGEEQVNGVMGWRVSFVERARPTLVKTLRGVSVPIEGSLWIEPSSGRILKTLVKTAGTPDPGRLRPPIRETLMWVVVTYAHSESLGIWVPETMSEWGRAPNGSEVSATATYSQFRRFEVNTTEAFQPTPGR